MSDQLVLVEPDRPTARCRRCFRLLRDPASVARRAGPTCATKDAPIDALDLAFALAWERHPSDDRAVARRWFREGAQAISPAAP